MKSKSTAHMKKEFPKLMVSITGKIILATREHTTLDSLCLYGTVVGFATPSQEFRDDPIGYYTDVWCADQFADYNGEVTLSND